ncbi:hypothetical protein FGO68_gene4504 [Halteria grandinella]|uniref:Uncharacterized protein n=1 Tax=Halteria grandinella TaxID=5974 RepID=A0A8J8P416_HALGN|nr:hypothetical protein FGO68_gene4504 [Halteria grandinella]
MIRPERQLRGCIGDGYLHLQDSINYVRVIQRRLNSDSIRLHQSLCTISLFTLWIISNFLSYLTTSQQFETFHFMDLKKSQIKPQMLSDIWI